MIVPLLVMVVELVEKEVAVPPTIDNLKKIVKDKQNQIFMFKDGKARVDAFKPNTGNKKSCSKRIAAPYPPAE